MLAPSLLPILGYPKEITIGSCYIGMTCYTDVVRQLQVEPKLGMTGLLGYKDTQVCIVA